MPDLKLAAQTAIYAALNVPAVTALAPVYQHVPDDTQPPAVVIDRMNVTAIGGKGGGLDLIEFDILTFIREPGREHLTPIMTAVRALLEEQALPAQSGVALSRPVFEADEDDVSEDGQTYSGLQRFSLVAQAA